VVWQRAQLPPRAALGRCILQISCGPFHCAAVTNDGALFTWGEGFGGKLGHGDQVSRSQPAAVAALAGMTVLSAACGVWHTAAIAVDPEGSPYAPLQAGASHQQDQHGSPARLEGGSEAFMFANGVDGAAPRAGSPQPLEAQGAAHKRNNSTSSDVSGVPSCT
jgi:hypothetical protein